MGKNRKNGNRGTRPTVKKYSFVGNVRHNVFFDAIARYNQAIDAGFFVEAVALVESLISDRMESFVNEYFEPDDYSNDKLFNLCSAIQKTKEEEIKKIADQINNWKNQRNDAIHALAKIEETDTENPFRRKYKAAEECAKEGMVLFRKLDKAILVYRKRKNQQTPSR